MNGKSKLTALLCCATSLALLAACGSSDGGTGPGGGNGGSFDLAAGSTAPAINGQQLQLSGGTSGEELLLVVTDTSASASGTSNYTIAATGTAAPGAVSGPSTTRIPSPGAVFGDLGASGPQLDMSYGVRANERFRGQFTGMIGSARASRALIPSAPSRAVQVGDIITFNVDTSGGCTLVNNHPARVVAIGTQSIVVTDTLNPAGGFTSADYQRFAANFDTLIYPVDVGNFGAPADIDGNGKVVLLFTRAVNELTPRNNPSFVGGYFSDRDLFPKTSTARLQGCPGSNVGEMFYLLAPDPLGTVNGNVRTTGFVDSLTTGVVGHEFQHLINASRRIYVNNASAFEEVWLNEGLSHIAEELLFFRKGQVGPRQNITIAALRANPATRNAFNEIQAANASRYRSHLQKPSTSSPIRGDDSLETRGATYDLLRYATDRKVVAGGSETQLWQALVAGPSTGVANLRAVYGADVGGLLRDWNVSNYADDVVPAVATELTQPSWNWHDVYPALSGGGGTYPLLVSPLPLAGTSGTVIPGGAAYYRFSVPANATATITVSGGSASTGLVQGTVLRLR